ncbi:MAG: hypothetical protein OXQ27_07505 [Chloroflexota bacterium]|nr:hypothetical protein [Chloroflexota bacterium]
MKQIDQIREVIRDRGALGALRLLLPSPVVPIPKKQDMDADRQNAALSIVARQGEGSVLVSAGLIDMTGVDLNEDNVQESAV